MPRIPPALTRLALLGGLLGVLGLVGGLLGGFPGGRQAQAQEDLRAVPFAGMAAGESYTAGAAMLRIAGTAREGAELARLADQPDLATQLRGVDFRTQDVVAIFAGPVGSSGHGLAVRAVLAGPGAVRISVELIRPRPGQNANDVIAYPYAVIAVPRAALPAAGTWTVTDGDGQVLIRHRR